jgi:hypothetical protein
MAGQAGREGRAVVAQRVVGWCWHEHVARCAEKKCGAHLAA